MADLHAAHTKVKAVRDMFPARETVPQNAPERRLRHICERYENEMAKVALMHFDAIREDIRNRSMRLAA